MQVQALRLMALLAASSQAARTRLGELGACKVVIRAMKSFPQERLVQHAACLATAKLADGLELHKTTLGATSCVELIVQAMKTFSDSPKVQAAACEALGVLVSDAEENLLR